MRAAFRIDIGGELDTAVSLTVENGRITRIYAIRNPHKLARLGAVSALDADLSHEARRPTATG